MDNKRIATEGITFDDVLLLPGKSDFVPSQADTSTRLTNNIRLNIPIIAAAMDTVTETVLAIAMAQEGGIGIIHKNLDIAAQKREVAKVKRSENGVIQDPLTLAPDDTVSRALEVMNEPHKGFTFHCRVMDGDPGHVCACPGYEAVVLEALQTGVTP